MIVSGEYQPILREFASRVIGVPLFDDNSKAIGLILNNEIKAAVVYNAFSSDNTRKWNDCQMHVAAKPGAKWASREFLYHAFNYPFNVLGCRRVTGLVKVDNIAAQKFDEKIGFVKEGVLRRAIDNQDAIIYGMLKEECKWLDYKTSTV